MGSEDPEVAKSIKMLGHPLRIRIIEIVGSSGPISWKDLSNELGASTGSLYHHLDVLEGVVTRDSTRRYALTKVGREIYVRMKSVPPGDTRSVAEIPRNRSVMESISDIAMPRVAIQWLSSTKTRSLLSSIGIAALVLLSMVAGKVEVILLSLSPTQEWVQSVYWFGASLLVLFLGGYALSILVKARGEPGAILVSACFAFIPLAVFSLILEALGALSPSYLSGDYIALTLIFVLFQGWSAAILGAGLSVVTGLRLAKSLLWSVAILYTSALLIALLGIRFV